jgi:hypothetical protein
MSIVKLLGAVALSGVILVLSDVPASAQAQFGPQAQSNERGAAARPGPDRRPPVRPAPNPRPGPVASVPEIDAASGLAAFAAIFAALALAWERRQAA